MHCGDDCHCPQNGCCCMPACKLQGCSNILSDDEDHLQSMDDSDDSDSEGD